MLHLMAESALSKIQNFNTAVVPLLFNTQSPWYLYCRFRVLLHYLL